jgi:uroporphyrinogen decarboxylase
MTGLERTLNFIQGESVDHPPFHPIIMRWAAKYAGIKYRDFCLDPGSKCRAMIKCANDFNIDWVTVMSDPWAEGSAFGIQVEYPEDNLPIDKSGHLPDAKTTSVLKHYNPLTSIRCNNRLKEIMEFRQQTKNELFIVGWVEGAVAEYVDLRGASNASVDFLTEPEAVEKSMDIIVECYYQYAFKRQKRLVEHIKNEGAVAKLHICGNTSAILPGMIATGAGIIDIDHLVPSMSDFMSLLGPDQVFSGKADPVTIIQDGTNELIKKSVLNDLYQSKGRCIVSAGCEITPGTSVENMKSFGLAATEAIQS